MTTHFLIQPEYIMVRYLNYLIITFMNIKENIKDERKHNRVFLQNYTYLSCNLS